MTGALDPESGPLDRGELQDRAIRGAAWTIIHTFVSLPIAFMVNLVIARVLGVADYGRLAFLTSLMEVAGGIVALGLTPAVVQYGSKAHAAGRHGEVRHLLSASQGFRLIVAAPLLTLLVIAVAKVDTTLLVLAIVFGVWVPAALDGAMSCLTLENKTSAGAKIVMVSNVLLQIAVLIALFTVGTADAVWAARLVIGAAVAGLCMIPIARDYRRAVVRPALPRDFPPGFWKFAIPTGIGGVVAGLVLSRTEVFFLTWLSTPAAVGVFALAFGLASHVFAPAQALIGPLIPAISGLREVDSEYVRAAFERTIRAGSTMIAVLCAMALPPLAVLVPLLYGRGYRDAAPLLLVLGIAGGFLVAAGPVSAFVMARLSAKRMLVANVCALAVDLALAVALIPSLGAWGAVLANVSGAGTRLLMLVRDELPHLEMSWLDASRLGVPIAVGAVASALAWGSTLLLPNHEVLAAVIAVAVGAGMLVGGLWITRSGLTPEDAGAIARVVPARLRRMVRPFFACLTARPRASRP